MHRTFIRRFCKHPLFSGCFVLALSVLGGCAHSPQTEPFLAKQDVLHDIELTDVPFIAQSEYQCGPAALAMMFQFNGLNIDETDLKDEVYVPNRQGSFQIELKAATRKRGLVPYEISGQLDQLYKAVSAGYPVLILQNQGLDLYPVWHYAVVVGFDMNEQNIVLRSGTTKRWVTPIDVFENSWRKAAYWGFVMVLPSQPLKYAIEHKWLSAAYELEQVGQLDAAEVAYRSAQKRWVKSQSATVLLTNLLFKQKRYIEAEQQLHDWLKVQPNSATVWNNYAYVLNALECKNLAIKAVQCARQLAPDDGNIQASEQDLRLETSLNKSSNNRINMQANCPSEIPICP